MPLGECGIKTDKMPGITKELKKLCKVSNKICDMPIPTEFKNNITTFQITYDEILTTYKTNLWTYLFVF